ncbi:hypothetical protein K438DRAFT_1791150 [Mycena galopus ATCC 62051]|nr:hypothetical protein K438DRAFT_1791150 [Mycena galopus ATCC 62051]
MSWVSQKLLCICVHINQPGAIVKTNWPNLKDHDESTTSICPLQDTPFDQGKTKQVHKAIYEGLPWVAQRFCNIGADESQVDIQENLGYFGTRLIREARKQDVEIEQGIRVTDFKLGVEIVDNNVIQLLSKVQHWNGTNEHPPYHRHKLGSTLNGFSHYAYLLSLESMIFCDLQTPVGLAIMGKQASLRHLNGLKKRR